MLGAEIYKPKCCISTLISDYSPSQQSPPPLFQETSKFSIASFNYSKHRPREGCDQNKGVFPMPSTVISP